MNQKASSCGGFLFGERRAIPAGRVLLVVPFHLLVNAGMELPHFAGAAKEILGGDGEKLGGIGRAVMAEEGGLAGHGRLCASKDRGGRGDHRTGTERGRQRGLTDR